MKNSLIIAILLLIFLVSAVSAETYKVVSGDSLIKIASKYPGISYKDILEVNRNKIKDQGSIRVGQDLIIPDANSVTHYWRYPGGEPFTKNRDKVRAIRMLSLPEKVKEEAIEKLQKNEWTYFTIQNGDIFEEMFFGNYKKWSNIVVAWPEGRVGKGRQVSIKCGNKIYHIAYPFVCHNISWWSEDIVTPTVVPAPVVKIVKKEKTKKPEKFWADYDAYLWAGHFWATSGSAYSNYYGGKFNLWLNRHQTSFGLLKEGVSTIYNGWDGKSAGGYAFHGKRWTVGPVISLLRDDNSETIFSVQLGKQTDVGRSADGYYHAKQKTDILHFGVTHDFYPKTKHIDKVSMYAEYSRDIGHSKKSTWKQWDIDPKNDKPTNKSSIAGGVKLHTWKTAKVKGGVMGGADYGWEDSHRGVELGVFISDLNEYVAATARFRNVSHSVYSDANGNSIGVGLELDLSKVIKKIVRNAKEKKMAKPSQ